MKTKILRRCASKLLSMLLIMGGAGCATLSATPLGTGPVPTKLQALERRVLDDSRQFEALLDQRGAVYEEPALTAYLEALTRRLLAADGASAALPMRVRVMHDPSLNAFALAHGTLFLTTGMLARLENADQAALLIGHEASHVLHRDMLAFTQSLHQHTVSAKVTDLLLTPTLAVVGAGGLSELGIGVMYRASVAGYERDQEARADTEGFAWVQRSGHDLAQGAHLFHLLHDDETRYRHPRQWALLQDHPTTERRLTALKAACHLAGEVPPSRPDPAYLAVTESLRLANIISHHRLREYGHALEAAEQWLALDGTRALAHYARGETYRLMADDPEALKEELTSAAWRALAQQRSRETLVTAWRQAARSSLTQALAQDASFSEAHRGLGLLLLSSEERQEAASHLREYLQRQPDARDRRYVQRKLDECQQATQGSAP